MHQPCISRQNAQSIRQICDTSDQIVRGLRALGEEAEHRDNWLNYIILSKLDGETRKQWYFETSNIEFPAFGDLITFLNRIALSLEANQTTTTTTAEKARSSSRPLKVHISNNIVSCPICHENHRIYSCESFRLMSSNERRSHVIANRLCFNCLSPGHACPDCKSSSTCRSCSRKHHTLLHSSFTNPQSTSIQSTNVSTSEAIEEAIDDKIEPIASTSSENIPHSHKSTFAAKVTEPDSHTTFKSILPTAIINIKSVYGKWIQARALLDSGSEVSFITSSLFRKLGITCNHAKQVVTGLAEASIGTTKGSCTIQIASSKSPIHMHTFILPKLTGNIPSQRLDVNMEFASHLTLADPQFMTPNTIDVLIGVDYFFDVMLSGKCCDSNGHHVAPETGVGLSLPDGNAACSGGGGAGSRRVTARGTGPAIVTVLGDNTWNIACSAARA